MTLVINPTVDTLTNRPRIRLSVSGSSAAPHPVGSSSSVTVFRINPDGIRRQVIVASGAALSGGAWVDFDMHAPFNAQVSYIAVVDGVTSDPALITLPSTVSWFMHPNDPTLSTPVSAINEIGDRVKASTAVLTYPLDSPYPISMTQGSRHAATGSVIVRLSSQGEQAAVDALLNDSGAILLNLAGPDQNTAWWDESWAWVQPGDITYSNPGGSIWYPYRHLSFPYTVLDTPVGEEVPIWTYADVAANYASYSAVASRFRNYSDLATDTQSTPSTGLLQPDSANPGYYGTGALVPDPSNPGYYLPGS